ncbi:hypothetical protein TcasGA2_TC007864 [Tribolium castaneum]|uniref:Uncharacterized protein n=1 Tax=Tribolium castaneum TaxID=7070 RepID=D2A2J1_TRICA|nr:hypothetical protein TcasGA2_TC007864 [Tribolium castaneum]
MNLHCQSAKNPKLEQLTIDTGYCDARANKEIPEENSKKAITARNVPQMNRKGTDMDTIETLPNREPTDFSQKK